MKTTNLTLSRPRRSTGLAGAALALAVAASLAGCGDDSPTPPPSVDAGTPPRDAGEEVGFAPGGAIPPPPDGATIPPIVLDAAYATEDGCCQVELSIADPDGNETTARLMGDRAPLDVAGGVALAHSNGRWRASVCLPLNTKIAYRFHFGTKDVTPEIPPIVDASLDTSDIDASETDAYVAGRARTAFRGRLAAGDNDAGEEIDAFDPGPVVDGGAGQEEDGGDKPEAGEGQTVDAGLPPDASLDAAEPDAPVTKVEDYRCADEAPTQIDVDGNRYNLFYPIVSCTAP